MTSIRSGPMSHKIIIISNNKNRSIWKILDLDGYIFRINRINRISSYNWRCSFVWMFFWEKKIYSPSMRKIPFKLKFFLR